MTTLPDTNESYGSKDYWTNRFKTEKTYDWLIDYHSIKSYISKYIDKQDSIFILGCGNSLLGEQLVKDGYRAVFSMDYCENVVINMSSHCDYCKQINWLTMDALHLAIKDNWFDVVIEKATIDTFLVGESNLWSLSSKASSTIDQVLSQVSKILKPFGQFISISFNQPHFRGPILSKDKYDWSIQSLETIGDDFNYYLYVLQKGTKSPNKSEFYSIYEPPTVTKLTESNEQNEPENNIFDINL